MRSMPDLFLLLYHQALLRSPPRHTSPSFKHPPSLLIRTNQHELVYLGQPILRATSGSWVLSSSHAQKDAGIRKHPGTLRPQLRPVLLPEPHAHLLTTTISARMGRWCHRQLENLSQWLQATIKPSNNWGPAPIQATATCPQHLPRRL